MLFGAGGVTRTPDLLITNQLLYQLSYTSLLTFCGTPLSLSLTTISDLLITNQLLYQLSYTSVFLKDE